MGEKTFGAEVEEPRPLHAWDEERDGDFESWLGQVPAEALPRLAARYEESAADLEREIEHIERRPLGAEVDPNDDVIARLFIKMLSGMPPFRKMEREARESFLATLRAVSTEERTHAEAIRNAMAQRQ